MSALRASPLEKPLAKLSAHMQAPLFRNGYALLFSGVTTSALGLLYWALAARLYPAAIVGVNSAVLSAMLLLSGMAQLSLNNVLVRFIPVAGPKLGKLLGYSYTASTLAALIFTLVFMAGLALWSPALLFLNQSLLWQVAFGVGILAWGVFTLQDSVLTGLRRTVWVPIENTIFAVVKILLLVGFATLLPQAGIYLSWTIPVVLSLLPINGLIWYWLRHGQAAPELEPPPTLTLGALARYVAGNYLGTLFFLVYTNLLPLMVANSAGAEAAAYFYLPWTIASGMQLIAIHLTTSLTVEGALHPKQLYSDARRALIHAARLLVPLVLMIFVGAPWFLTIFGKNYSAEGTALLRWLSLAAIPNLIIVIALGLARVQNRPLFIAAIQGLLGVLTLALTSILLPTFGIAGAGLGWLLSQTIGAGLVSLWLLRLRRQGQASAPSSAVLFERSSLHE